MEKPSHINVLEVSSGTGVLTHVASSRAHCRFAVCVASSVARGALAKGRSTSRMFQPMLRRSAVLQVCYDLHPVWLFCPTRLNVADNPTRDEVLWKRVTPSILACEGIDFRALHRAGLRRFAANWIRLFLLVCLTSGVEGFPLFFLLPEGEYLCWHGLDFCSSFARGTSSFDSDCAEP